jgi:hypothetical protein
MTPEQLRWRVGVPADVMRSAAELDAHIRRRREQLLELCTLERDIALEQRIETRKLNRLRAEYGYAPLPLPAIPNRSVELELGAPQVSLVQRRAPALRRPPSRLRMDPGGSVIHGLVVPFNERTRVADPPTFVPYVEQLPAGAVEIPRRPIELVFERDGEAVGQAEEFEASRCALFGRFRLGGDLGARVLDMVRHGMLTGFAPVFAPLETVVEGVTVVRKRVRLEKVAVCRESAYRDAWIAVSR